MPQFRFTKWDGTQPFVPQSADTVFDQLSEYLMDYGEEVLDNLQDWEETNPEIVQMLMQQGFVEKDENGKYVITPNAVKRVQSKALEELFNVNRKDSLGQHETEFRGAGQTIQEETKAYEFGDPVANLNMQETLRNALARQGGGTPISISEDDLMVHDTEYQTSCATVLLLDMSGSMSRYGKYGAAKKVALAMQGLVRGKYQGDFFQVVGFYTYANAMTEKQLVNSAPKVVSIFDPRVSLTINFDNPPGFVPEHFTNIHAGLQFARRILSKQPSQNKQIIVVTDGEPTAHIEGRNIRLIYPPSEKTARITLAEAKRCADDGIHMSTFALIEDYFYLELTNFVEKMARVTNGISATCNAQDMGNMVIQSFTAGRKKTQRMG